MPASTSDGEGDTLAFLNVMSKQLSRAESGFDSDRPTMVEVGPAGGITNSVAWVDPSSKAQALCFRLPGDRLAR